MRTVILVILAVVFGMSSGAEAQIVKKGAQVTKGKHTVGNITIEPPPPAFGENVYCTAGAPPELSEGTPLWGIGDHVALFDDKCYHTALSSTPTGTHMDSSPGNTFVPAAASNLTAVLASANGGPPVTLGGVTSGGTLRLTCGDTIQLAQGAQYIGAFTVPSIACDGGHWIFWKSAGVSDVNFPAEGVQATPCIAGISNDATNGRNLPGYPDYPCPAPVLATKLTAQLRTTGIPPALSFASGANHYRFIGLEIAKNPTTKASALVSLAADHATLGANHIIFDRVIIHGVPWTVAATNNDSTQAGISADGSMWVALLSSWDFDTYCIDSCVDSQAFNGGTNINQDGKYKLWNNLMASSGETYIFGGGGLGAGMPNPRGFEARHNWFMKPLTWMVPIETCGVYKNVVPKNLGEFKNMTYAFVEGNVYMNSWTGCQSDQIGYGVLLNPSSQNNHKGISVNFNGTDVVTISSADSFTQGGINVPAGIPNDPVYCPPGGCRLEIADLAHRPSDNGFGYRFCNGVNGCDQVGVSNLKCAYGTNANNSCSVDTDCPGSARAGRCAPTTVARLTSTVAAGSAITVNACVPGDCPTCRNQHIVFRLNEIYNTVNGFQINTGLSSHCHDEAAGMQDVYIGDVYLHGLSVDVMSNGSDRYSSAEAINISSNIEGNVLHNIEVAHLSVGVETSPSTTSGGFGDQVDHTNRHHLLNLNIRDSVSPAAYNVNRSSGSIVTKGVGGLSGLANVYQTDACRAYYPVEAPNGTVLASQLQNFTFIGFSALSYMVTVNGQNEPIAAPPAAWSSGTTYASGTRATYNSVVYASLQNGNLNHTPNSSPTWWRPGFALVSPASAKDDITVRDLNDCPFNFANNILGTGLPGSGKPNSPYYLPSESVCGTIGTSPCLLATTNFTGIFANWNNGRNGNLTITDPTYVGSATDANSRGASGKNPGADLVSLAALTAGVRSGAIFYPALTVTSGTLPGATVGAVYQTALQASAGASPFKLWFQETDPANCVPDPDCGTPPPNIVIGRGGVVNGPFAISTVSLKTNRAKILLTQTLVVGANGWSPGQKVTLTGFCVDGANPCTDESIDDAAFNGTWLVAATNADCANSFNVVCLVLAHANIPSHAPLKKGTNNPVTSFAPTTAGTFIWWMGARDGAAQTARASVTLTVLP